jgi:hypothetical protein
MASRRAVLAALAGVPAATVLSPALSATAPVQAEPTPEEMREEFLMLFRQFSPREQEGILSIVRTVAPA